MTQLVMSWYQKAKSPREKLAITLTLLLGAIISFGIYGLPYIDQIESKFEPPTRVTQEDGRFVSNNSGIVLDTKTGLEWYAGPDRDTTGVEAISWIENLNRDEFSGGYWGMPTISDLKTLCQDGVGARNMRPLLKTTGWWVWSREKTKGGYKWFYGSLHLRQCNTEWRAQEGNSFYGRVFAVRMQRGITNTPGSAKEVASPSGIPSQQENRIDDFIVSSDFYLAIHSGAKPVKFTFKGVVRGVDDYGRSDLNRYFSIGDTFSGYYIFDSMTKDSKEASDGGWYRKPYFNHPDSFVVVFNKDPVNLMFKLKVPMTGWNVDSISTYFNWPYYNYRLSAGLQGDKVGNSYISGFSWHTYCPTTDDSLPIYPPILNKDWGGMSFRPCSSKGGQCPVVTFQITSLSIGKLYSANKISESGN